VAGLAQDLFEVKPRRVDAFRIDIRTPVEQVVEQLHPGVRLGDLVDFREGEREAEGDGAGILAHHAELVAEVAAGLVDAGEQAFVCL